MADKQKVSVQDIEACKARYLSSLSTLQDSVAKYEKSLMDLSSDYTGAAFAIMSAKVIKRGADLKRSFDKLKDAVTELGEVKDIYEENEQNISNSANNLDVGAESPFRE